MEMAQAHRRLGCDVTVLEGARALGKDDPDLSAVVLQQMREEGVTIAEGQNVARVSGREGAVTVTTESGESFSGSHLLIAVGRKLNIEGLDLEKANIAHDRAITVGDDLRSTSNRRVYAIGDVAGGLQFTHVAGYHAGVVLPAMLFGLPSKARTHHLPWVTYTSPELAQVGMTEAQAREVHGDKLTVARFDMAENDRAIAEDRRSGFAKVMVVGGRPVGASIVGAKAGDLIGYWAMAIANKLKMKALSDTVLPYPTMSEINKRAAGAYFSPKLFDSTLVKNAVGTVQRFLP
jgi:pyruvate/2-oxoglutarate dehydrogenase complex dihydrolipoamide dehydrogenase (E3) component